MAGLKRGMTLASSILLAMVITSACNQPFSQAPVVTNTPIDTSLFATPLLQTPVISMSDVANFGTQTAMAQTGMPFETSTAGIGTPQESATPTPIIGMTPADTATATLAVGGNNTPVVVSSQVVGTQPTALPPGPKPASYTMQSGEFVYCIARRFNVDPDETLALNGLFDSQTIYAGLVVKIPQSGKPFPGDRMLRQHPTTYTVSSSNQSLSSIACEFGDIDPAAIAQANGLSAGAALTSGQQLSIP